MVSNDLKNIITTLGLSQTDFARLVGVTPRAVTLWMMEDRAIPGPAEAYARLLAASPMSVRQIEFARLKGRSTEMRDGMYSVEYTSITGSGQGVVILDNGRLYGADPFGGKYDGDYTFNEHTKMAELRLKLTFAPNAPAVFGIQNPYEWSIDATAQLNPLVDNGTTRLITLLGPHIDATYHYLRALPEA